MGNGVSKRSQWKNQSTFVLAAIGSAVGLGSIWRFPFVCAQNGGGAFLIAYVTAMLIVGLPMLVAELSAGHRVRGSICKVFSLVNPKLELLGWLVLVIAFIIVSYYVVIMGWTFKYLVDAFTLQWGTNTDTFFNEITLRTSLDSVSMWQIQWKLLFFLLLAWVMIVACIWKGPESIGKIIHTSIYIPALILIVMVVRGTTLEGSSLGWNYYLRPDFTRLLSVEIWLAAFTQAFFSLGTGLGVMFAYGSYLSDQADIFGNAVIIAVSTTLVAFLGGLAVFGSLGFLSIQTGTPIEEIANKGGAGLAFVSYPAIINGLPVFKKTFGVLFFTMLLVLSLNSAFSMVEAIASALRDKFNWSHKKANLTISLSSFTLGILFVTRGGYAWLGHFDYFASNIGIAIACTFNCLIIGWFLGTQEVITHLRSMPGLNVGKTWSMLIRYVIFGLLVALITAEITVGHCPFTMEKYPPFMVYITTMVISVLIIIAIIISRMNKTYPSNVKL